MLGIPSPVFFMFLYLHRNKIDNRIPKIPLRRARRWRQNLQLFCFFFIWVSHSLSTGGICYLDTFTWKHFFFYCTLKVNVRFSVVFTEVRIRPDTAKKNIVLDEPQLVCRHYLFKFYSFATSFPLSLEKCYKVFLHYNLCLKLWGKKWEWNWSSWHYIPYFCHLAVP